ncbi:ABC transporter permease [Alkalilimnicola sp. S0819]|uniref:ABC transporter permease n=1 Tax=Alkalilimnicola sp. S0819 TaxID=2613922 RepID=UPI0012620B5C|nr:ABC transporter permease subunit [Alkalilimnicola sp. S0819]KAB7627353.1 ABC transporter permease subunit [Alkalilimnicola sp. S0819]MPQ16071.1 ABC transporter permease subunit [Alkalilimnicola sp. S0819]
MYAILARELRSLFASPLAWLILGSTQFALAWWFMLLVDQYEQDYQPLLGGLNSPLGVTDLVVAPFFSGLPLLAVLLLMVALLAMRLLAEERRSGTLPLLLSSPVSGTGIVLGKYLGGLAFLALLVLLWSLMPLSLLLVTGLDVARVLAMMLGLLLLAAALLAPALYLSSLSEQPAGAAAASFVLSLMLLMLGQGAGGEGALSYLGALGHYQGFTRGVVASPALAYYLLLIVGFLGFTVRRLDALRLQA